MFIKLKRKSVFVPSSASEESQDIPGLCDQLGADAVGLSPHPVPAPPGHAGLPDQL